MVEMGFFTYSICCTINNFKLDNNNCNTIVLLLGVTGLIVIIAWYIGLTIIRLTVINTSDASFCLV